MSCLCVVCVPVWSWSALQFALQDLKIVTIWQILHVHPLFVLYCIVWYNSVYACLPRYLSYEKHPMPQNLRRLSHVHDWHTGVAPPHFVTYAMFHIHIVYIGPTVPEPIHRL